VEIGNVDVRILVEYRDTTMETPKDQKRQQQEAKIPALCQFWRTLPRRLPVVKLGRLDVSLTVASALFLAAIRLAAEFVMIRAFGWPENAFITKNAAASVGAIFHSLQLVPALAACFLSSSTPYNPSQMLSEATGWWQETVTALLQFCTGYMIYDALLNILWLNSTMAEKGVDAEALMFLGHHLATTLYMTSTRIVGGGHQSAMVCMLLGEFTNPLHNSFYIAQAAQKLPCCNGPLSQSAFAAIEASFCALYCLIRVIVAPTMCLHMTVNLFMTGWRENRIPIVLVAMWTLLIWAVLIGSIPWIVECWTTLQRYFPALSLLFGRDSSAAEL
jgi:hypothetical protein